MSDYTEVCRSNNCKHLIEWELDLGNGCQTYDCYSCTKVGQSYVVDEFPDDCPHKDAMLRARETPND